MCFFLPCPLIYIHSLNSVTLLPQFHPSINKLLSSKTQVIGVKSQTVQVPNKWQIPNDSSPKYQIPNDSSPECQIPNDSSLKCQIPNDSSPKRVMSQMSDPKRSKSQMSDPKRSKSHHMSNPEHSNPACRDLLCILNRPKRIRIVDCFSVFQADLFLSDLLNKNRYYPDSD